MQPLARAFDRIRELPIATHVAPAGSEQTFELEAGVEPQPLIEGLAALLPCEAQPPRSERLVLLDTVDGRLTRGRALLMASPAPGGTHLALGVADAAHDRESLVESLPAFAADLPAPLRDVVATLIEMRRLLPVLEVHRRQSALDVLDGERKTVARLAVLELSVRKLALPALDAAAPAPGRALPALLVVRPLRGYESALEALLPVLRSRPGLKPARHGPQQRLLGLLSAALPAEPPSPGAGLRPELPAEEAMRRIHRALLAAIRFHERGVRHDLDSEFLHDLRVAVRRSRCLLGQIRRVFPAEEVEHWRGELSWLGRLTGPLRDLDVFLLLLGDGAIVTAEDAIALAPLVEHVQHQRREEQARLVAELESPRFAQLVSGWAAFLARDGAEDGARDARKPIARVAGKRVARLYRRIVKRGRALRADSAAPAFHALRIAAKKMRYVLDCTRSAFADEGVAPLLAALKRVQSALGEAQDAAVQRPMLAQAALALAAAGKAPAATLVAVGRLDERLRQRAESARGRFAAELDALATDALRATARRLPVAHRRRASETVERGAPAKAGKARSRKPGGRKAHARARASGHAPARATAAKPAPRRRRPRPVLLPDMPAEPLPEAPSA